MTKTDWVSYSTNVYEQIDDWLEDAASYDDLSEYLKDRVMGQSDIDLIVSNIYVYLRNIWRGLDQNNNMIITAPSGTGKTETYRALKDYFKDAIPKLPIFLIDATQLTPSGYKGSNLDEVLAPLFMTNDTEPPAIIFIDEIDKRIMPSGGSNDFGINVQHNLLTILEGGNITDTNRRGERPRTISTANVLFIGLGSFDEYRRVKTDKRGIGFINEETKDTYLTLTPEIMLDAGATPELMGRFPFVMNYNRLEEKDLKQIIKKCIDGYSIMYDCDIDLKKNYERKLLLLADSKFGCRAIKNKLQTDLLNVYTKAMCKQRKNSETVLSITLDDEMSFSWREYTEEERRILNELNPFATTVDEKECKKSEDS